MSARKNIHPNNKLTITYYVEAGCLGAAGEDLIHQFCDFISAKLNHAFKDICAWQVLPLSDINKAHIAYQLQNKKLDYGQAKKYLKVINVNIDTFQDNLDEKVVHFIEEFMGR